MQHSGEITGHLLGHSQLEFSGLEIIRLDRKDDIGSTRIPFLLFLSSLLFLDLVKKLHKAVPGPVPALWEVSTRWPSPDVEGFPNPRSLPRHLPSVTQPQPGLRAPSSTFPDKPSVGWLRPILPAQTQYRHSARS